jgi:nitrogen-specific signal transduction histidine kinase
LRQLELFLRYGAGSGIRIVFELAPDIPNYLMDQSQLNAAMLNLVINARDAMPNGGEIQISTALWEVKTTTTQSPPAPGTYVRVRVKDAGQGMPPRTLQRIFDPFFTTKGEQGTGLGLPQVCAFHAVDRGLCQRCQRARKRNDLRSPVSLSPASRPITVQGSFTSMSPRRSRFLLKSVALRR